MPEICQPLGAYGEPTALEKREAVDVADGEVMPHVEFELARLAAKL